MLNGLALRKVVFDVCVRMFCTFVSCFLFLFVCVEIDLGMKGFEMCICL